MVAAVKEAVDSSRSIPIVGRRSMATKSSARSFSTLGSLPSPPMSLPTQRLRSTLSSKIDQEESAIDDDQRDDFGDDEGGSGPGQSLTRRMSEGQNFMKDSKKANANDLKCDKCGKEYKHSSCLSKHLWEHTPEWSYTSKLLISKHQQVQLLEAASVLVTMNQDACTTPPLSARDPQSDHEPVSPTASGSSESQDSLRSTDTTPPPQAEMFNPYRRESYTAGFERSSGRNGLNHSYHTKSSPARFLGSASVPSASTFRNYPKISPEQRPPSSSGFSRDYEDEGLASAVKLLSCGFGNIRNSPIPPSLLTSEETPPVPNIPAQFLDHHNFASSIFSSGSHPRQTESYTRAQLPCDEDVEMESGESVVDDDEFDQRSQGHDEDYDGVFGRMEE